VIAGISTPSSGTKKPTAINTDADREVARKTLKAIQGHQQLPTSKDLSSKEITKTLVQEVRTTSSSPQMVLPETEQQPDIEKIVAETVAIYIERTIDIPRIVVLPKGEVTSGFKDFDLDTRNVHLQTVARDILIQSLQNSDARVKLESLESGGEEERLEDYLIRVLIDYNDISYDYTAKLLYKLAEQMVAHLRGYLSGDNEVRNVLLYYQRKLGDLIHAQMLEHYWENASSYEAVVTSGFTTPKQNAYSAPSGQPIQDFKTPVADRQNIRRKLFGGFNKCLYPVQKFDSDSERRFCAIVESDTEVEKWFKPARNDFQIYFRADEAYEPDFVVETKTIKYICEPKRSDQMKDETVLAKGKASVEWCKHATNHESKHKGKPWKYLLIPHDAIKSNMTIDGLAKLYSFQEDV
jgi:type III restriction enzyme